MSETWRSHNPGRSSPTAGAPAGIVRRSRIYGSSHPRVQTKILALFAAFVPLALAGLIMLTRDEHGRARLLMHQQAAELGTALDRTLELTGANLEAWVRDYTFWDDMVTFVTTGDSTWAYENMDLSLSTFGANVTWVYRNDGALVYSANDRDPSSRGLKQLVMPVWSRQFGDARFGHFFTRTPSGLVEVRGATVYPQSDPDRIGAPRGCMYAGFLWDNDWLKALSRATGGTMHLDLDVTVPGDTESGNPATGQITVARILKDQDGKPVGLLSGDYVFQGMRVMNSSASTQFVAFGAYTAGILIFLAIFLVAWVTRPLRLISQSLRQENPATIAGLKHDRTEFGEIARLIREFFVQKARLVREIAQREQAEAQLVRQEKLATIGQLANSMAHELRNPLGIMSNALYVLQNSALRDAGPGAADGSGAAPGKSLRYLRMIDEQIKRADRLIAGLADFARVRPLHTQPAQVAELVDRVLAGQKIPPGTQVLKNIPPDVPPVFVDPEQMRTVLVNLITNALQAMPAGGTLTISATRSGAPGAETGVSGTPPSSRARVLISILDTGCGIRPEEKDRVFEPFYSTKTYGIGFGLAITRILAEQNAGTISFESEVGKGTTFTVSLPVAAKGTV